MTRPEDLKDECINLAKDILIDFELSRLPIEKILFKCIRLCRLRNDDFGQHLFMLETVGYNDSVLPSEIVEAAATRAGRMNHNKETGKSTYYTSSLAALESEMEANRIRLSIASDPNVSVSSSNPNQFVFNPIGNTLERKEIVSSIGNSKALIQRVSGNLYSYILAVYYELEYGYMVNDIYSAAITRTTVKLGKVCPQGIKIINSIEANLNSQNPEDWANAVHSCRRIIKDLADELYPASDPIFIDGKKIKLGNDQYINRLVQFVSEKKQSSTHAKIINCDLAYIGNRLDAVQEASSKGTHSDVTLDEATKYVMHTFFLISDVLDFVDS